MPDWGVGGGDGTAWESSALTTATGIQAIASATVNVKGPWVTLLAATARDGDWLLVNMVSPGLASASYLIDIAIGAAGAEMVVIPNILFATGTAFSNGAQITMPMTIPAGSRISARLQCSVASGTFKFVALVGSASWSGYPAIGGPATDYGANTATSKGALIDTGATINVKGAWTQLSAATTSEASWLIVCLGTNSQPIAGSIFVSFDIGVGGAGVEQVLVSHICGILNSSVDVVFPCMVVIPVALPRGVRLVARASSNTTTAADRLFTVVVIGV